MRVARRLLFISDIFCPICSATGLYVMSDPEIEEKFLILQLDKYANAFTSEMAIFWKYSDQIKAEIAPTIMLGRVEDDGYYPYIFHIWKKGKPKPTSLTEEEKKHLMELKDHILKTDKELDVNPLKVPKAYNEWRKTYGLTGI